MRLTERDGDKVWFVHGRPRGFLCPRDFCDNAYGCDKVKDRTCPYLRLLDKLAAYEDTGLTPDEIKENIGLLSPICIGCDGKTADGKRTEKCTYVDDDFRKCLERSVHLSELAHAEKQGLLVKLPCKVGDTLYAPTRSFVSEFRITQFDFVGYEESYLWVEWHLTKGITGNYRMDGIRASEIGKTVFLSREEAEAALKGETR